MKKFALLVSSIFVLSTGIAVAGQPDSPGVFGKDRAAYIQGTLGTGAPGASEVGKILSSRAGENGSINRAYKEANGGSPNSANDSGAGNDSIY